MSIEADTIMLVNNIVVEPVIAFYNREKNLEGTLLIKQPEIQYFILYRRIVDSIM